MAGDALRLVIVDDHPVYRDGLSVLLDNVDDIDVVGTATTGEQAVELTVRERPDVVLMDIGLPGISGIEATRLILERAPSTGLLMLTMYDDDDTVFSAMRAGARGYVLKGADGEEIMHAVRSVGRGEAIFGPAVARRIGAFFAEPPVRPDHDRPFPVLTPRETEVLALAASGESNQAIAAHLFLSHKTVRNHISSIFAKLQVADRAEAIVLARRRGLGVEPGDEG